jgi:hypothetical protein
MGLPDAYTEPDLVQVYKEEFLSPCENGEGAGHTGIALREN